MRTRIELLFSLLVAVLLGWMIWEARAWPMHSRIFPTTIGVGVLLLALAEVVASARRAIRVAPSYGTDAAAPEVRAGQRTSQDRGEDVSRAEPSRRGRALVMCGWVVVFFLGVWLLGFRVGSFVLTAVFLKLAASEGWGVSLAAGAVSYLFFLVVFHWILQVPLPAGLLAESLGADSLDDYAIRSFRNLLR